MIEDVDSRRTGVELDVVASVVDHGLSSSVIEVKRRRRALYRLAGQFGWNLGHPGLEIHGSSGVSQEAQGLVAVDTHARIPKQLIGLSHDTLDGLPIQQFQLGSEHFFLL
jgi:hypothetical protein